MAYDRADWHYGGNFPASLPQEAGGTHIALFLSWMMLKGHVGPDHVDDEKEVLSGLVDRSVTPGAWFFQWCDGKFWKSDLDDEGNEFTSSYYCEEGGEFKWYIADLERVFPDHPEIYGVPDSWVSFDVLAPVLDARYRAWKKSKAPFWKRIF